MKLSEINKSYKPTKPDAKGYADFILSQGDGKFFVPFTDYSLRLDRKNENIDIDVCRRADGKTLGFTSATVSELDVVLENIKNKTLTLENKKEPLKKLDANRRPFIEEKV